MRAIWSAVCGHGALRAQKIANRKKEFVLNLEFEILNLFGILNLEF